MFFFSAIQKLTQKLTSKFAPKNDCKDENDHQHKNWWDKKWPSDDHKPKNDCGDHKPKDDCDDHKPKDDCQDDPKDDCGCEDKFVIDSSTVIVNGTAGADTIIAGEGNQTVYAAGGNDTVAGRSGNDQLSGGAGDDTISGDIGDDIICGGDGNDYLLGNRSDDQLYGCEGEDRLYGGEQNDVLRGGSGNDFLSGDEGDDVLYGDSGDDTFAYGKLTGQLDFGNDVIKDFELDGPGRDGDKIQIVNLGSDFDTYAEVIGAASQTAEGVLFDFGNDRTLLVEDVTIANLSADYFVF
jgi:Ca2+-binding RTX toxin-like protein